MLRYYFGPAKAVRGKDFHVWRDPCTGDISFDQKHNWHEFLINKGAAAMFCPVPTARRSRLRRQIAIIKTFWDISASLRGRRLLEIVRDNWPDEVQ